MANIALKPAPGYMTVEFDREFSLDELFPEPTESLAPETRAALQNDPMAHLVTVAEPPRRSNGRAAWNRARVVEVAAKRRPEDLDPPWKAGDFVYYEAGCGSSLGPVGLLKHGTPRAFSPGDESR